MLLLLLLAAADSDAGLVELLLLLQTLVVVMVRLEMVRLLGMESEVMSVAKQRQLHHSGPVKARLPRRALALEGLQGAVRTPLLAAHLRGAGPFICGLHLSLHPGPAGWCDRKLMNRGFQIRHCLAWFPLGVCEGWAQLLTSSRSNPQPGAPTLRPLQREIQAGLVRRCLPPL